jgi:hypothetical protein
MDTIKKTTIGFGAVLLAGLLSYVPAWFTAGIVEERMQKRQDGIVRNLNYNPLTRISNPEDFEKLYREEERAYDETGQVMQTKEDLRQFVERRNHWPYRAK